MVGKIILPIVAQAQSHRETGSDPDIILQKQPRLFVPEDQMTVSLLPHK